MNQPSLVYIAKQADSVTAYGVDFVKYKYASKSFSANSNFAKCVSVTTPCSHRIFALTLSI